MNRNTGLKRSPMPPPSSPLRRNSWMNSSGSLEPSVIQVPPLRERNRQQRRKDTGPSPAIRKLVLDRDGWACVCCGLSVEGQPYSLQHRKRRSQGGGNSPSNLIVVLGTGTTGCHERIDSRRDPDDEAKGYTVRSWQDPALVPVMVFSEHGSGAPAWLTDDGRYSFEAPEGAVA